MLLSLQDQINSDKSIVGNKAYNLSVLLSSNFNVAEGFILTSNAYQAFKKYNKSFFNNEENNLSMPKDLKNIIASELQTNHNDIVYFIVRSSGLNEDGIESSCAGQYKTVIGAKGLLGVINAIIECWHNYIISYGGRQSRIDTTPMPIVVQRLTFPFVSGVIFTANPILKVIDETVIESNYGFCSSIVDGEFAVDRFVINKITGDIIKNLAQKEYYYDFISESGLTKTKCSNKQVSTSSLNIQQIKKIYNLGEKITSLFQGPQDIEWGICYSKNQKPKIYIFQSRPITTISKSTNYNGNIEEDIALILK